MTIQSGAIGVCAIEGLILLAYTKTTVCTKWSRELFLVNLISVVWTLKMKVTQKLYFEKHKELFLLFIFLVYASLQKNFWNVVCSALIILLIMKKSAVFGNQSLVKV